MPDTMQDPAVAELEGISADMAAIANNILNQNITPEEQWQRLVTEVLRGAEVPFETHRQLFEKVYEGRSCRPMWLPDANQAAETFLGEWLTELGLSTVAEFYHWSITHREKFWSRLVEGLQIPFARQPEAIMDSREGVENTRWLPGASWNVADACLQAPDNHTALIVCDEQDEVSHISYGALAEQVNRVANGLQAQGIREGDAVAIDMMMTAEAVAIYLGIIKAGAVVVSIADSFAAEEIRVRLQTAEAVLVFTQDYIQRGERQLPMYDKVRQAADCPLVCVAHADTTVRLEKGDSFWEDFLSDNGAFSARPYESQRMINILFSSGTTGAPKAIPWHNSTTLKVAGDALLYMNAVSDDIWAWPTNLGWMMGPWLVFAALMNRGTMALFYGAPTDRTFPLFISRARVNKLGVIPSMVKTWRQRGQLEQVDFSAIELFASTAECSNPVDMLYLSAQAGYRPVMEYCGGTEIGGAYMSSTLLQPNAPSTFSTPAFGTGLVLLDEHGQVLEETEAEGEVALIPPAMGLSQTLLNKDHHQAYFAGMPTWQGVPLRRHGDQLQRLANGYLVSKGRADDTMNLGGIKTSSAEIEQVINHMEAVLESAAVAVTPPGGGPSQLVVVVVPQQAEASREALAESVQKQLRKQLNPLFKLHKLVLAESLPRTASNKIMRRVLRERFST